MRNFIYFDTYTVPTFALPYIINDDAEGLTDEEKQKIDRFLAVAKIDGRISNSDDEYFSAHNDIFGYLGATCCDLYQARDVHNVIEAEIALEQDYERFDKLNDGEEWNPIDLVAFSDYAHELIEEMSRRYGFEAREYLTDKYHSLFD